MPTAIKSNENYAVIFRQRIGNKKAPIFLSGSISIRCLEVFIFAPFIPI